MMMTIRLRDCWLYLYDFEKVKSSANLARLYITFKLVFPRSIHHIKFTVKNLSSVFVTEKRIDIEGHFLTLSFHRRYIEECLAVSRFKRYRFQ